MCYLCFPALPGCKTGCPDAYFYAASRGVGFSIVVSFLTVLCFGVLFGAISWSVFIGHFGAGALLSLIGSVDNHRRITARWWLQVCCFEITFPPACEAIASQAGCFLSKIFAPFAVTPDGGAGARCR